MSISSAAFAYIGVEIVAASALEARWPRPPEQNDEENENNQEAPNDLRVPLIGQTIQKSAIWVPVLVMIAYFIGGLLVSLIIPWDDPLLPRFSWIQDRIASEDPNRTTSSAFVAIAKYSEIPKLATVFNAFLVFTAITCASTNLYVASRSLFAMTSRLQSGGPGQPLLIRGLAWLGKTNRYKVPMRCIMASTLAFCWVPFLTLVKRGGTSTITPIDAVSWQSNSNTLY
jgi:yeast amino acid transporter